MVEAFPSRPLHVRLAHAVTQKVREGGWVVNVAVVIATGVNNEGRRESLGFDVITTEDGAARTAFLRSFVALGLSGVAPSRPPSMHLTVSQPSQQPVGGLPSSEWFSHWVGTETLPGRLPPRNKPAKTREEAQ